jgi:hypothetical protein
MAAQQDSRFLRRAILSAIPATEYVGLAFPSAFDNEPAFPVVAGAHIANGTGTDPVSDQSF